MKVCIKWNKIVSKVKEIVERAAMYTVCDIAQKVGISLLRAHHILKNILNVRKIFTRWVPHLLTDDQKKQRFKIVKQLLKIFPKYDEKNLVTGHETWFHYFEPVRKVSNKILATKNSKRPVTVCNLLLWWSCCNTGANEKGQKRYWEILQWCNYSDIEEIDKILSETTPTRGSNMSNFYMIMPQPIPLPLLQMFYKKTRSQFYHNLLIHQTLPLVTSSLLLYVWQTVLTLGQHCLQRPCPNT